MNEEGPEPEGPSPEGPRVDDVISAAYLSNAVDVEKYVEAVRMWQAAATARDTAAAARIESEDRMVRHACGNRPLGSATIRCPSLTGLTL